MNEKITKGPEVALLTKTESQWLNGNIQLSYAYERKIKSDIKKKVRILQELEIPLLVGNGFIPLQPMGVTANGNSVTANCNTDTAEKKPYSSLFWQTRKPWPGFGPGTFALPRQRSTRLSYQGTHHAHYR
jgi:hypothetical protein